MLGQDLGEAFACAVSGNCESSWSFSFNDFGGAAGQNVEIALDIPGRAADEKSVDMRAGDQFLAVAGVDRAAVEAWDAAAQKSSATAMISAWRASA